MAFTFAAMCYIMALIATAVLSWVENAIYSRKKDSAGFNPSKDIFRNLAFDSIRRAPA